MKPVLEINPDHEIVKKLEAATDENLVNDAAWLLLEQALLIEGVPSWRSRNVCKATESGFKPGSLAIDRLAPRGDRLLSVKTNPVL